MCFATCLVIERLVFRIMRSKKDIPLKDIPLKELISGEVGLQNDAIN